MRLAIAAAASLIAIPVTAGDARTTGTHIAQSQPLVELFGPHLARRRPTPSSRVVAGIGSVRPISSARTTLPVLARVTDREGRTWVRVRLPGRVLSKAAPPHTGWIRALRTLRSATPWHIVVDRALRRVLVYRAARLERVFPAIVGKPSTPTPPGEFFVEENVRLSRWQPGAPFALATSARSSVLQEFEGGPGQIALHGRSGVGGQLGTAVSHGCVRLGDPSIRWLAQRIPPGVPVTIR